MQLAKPGVLVQACSGKRIAAGSRPAWDTAQETLSPEKNTEPIQLANDIVIYTFQYNHGELGNGSRLIVLSSCMRPWVQCPELHE